MANSTYSWFSKHPLIHSHREKQFPCKWGNVFEGSAHRNAFGTFIGSLLCSDRSAQVDILLLIVSSSVLWIGIVVYSMFMTISELASVGVDFGDYFLACGILLIVLLFLVLIYTAAMIVPSAVVASSIIVLWLPRKTKFTLLVLRIAHIFSVVVQCAAFSWFLMHSIYELISLTTFCEELICKMNFFGVDMFYSQIIVTVVGLVILLELLYHLVILILSVIEAIRIHLSNRESL